MKFETIMDILDDFTRPPDDGDYDSHVQNAMAAVYSLMIQDRKHDLKHCPHCSCSEMLCGFNGVGCTSDKSPN